eukprot:scaffold7168_cov182-Amphora_coffeaeformis.AAC.6
MNDDEYNIMMIWVAASTTENVGAHLYHTIPSSQLLSSFLYIINEEDSQHGKMEPDVRESKKFEKAFILRAYACVIL